MKVLIISDDENTINFFESYLKEKAYDVIFYKWLIKAIDNIEEIKPDIIVISSAEYPRHWKTLASFIQSGIGGSEVKLYLYEPCDLSQEEQNKAKALGITAFFTSLNKEKLDEFFPSLLNKNDFLSKKDFDKEIIITNPIDGSLLSGKFINQNENEFQCKIYSPELKAGQLLKQVSIYSEGKVLFLSADVTDNNIEKEILSLSVCEYYEEI